MEEILIMKRQSVAGLFFSMFLRAAVIILGIAIVVFGIVFLTKVMKGDGNKTKTPATTIGDNVLTDAEARDDLLYNDTTLPGNSDNSQSTPGSETSYDKKILVLNSTDEVGLAGRWCDELSGHGYNNTEASDYSEALATTKIVSTTAGVGEDLIAYFNGATYEVGVVSSGVSVSTDGFDIVIIIGTADSDK